MKRGCLCLLLALSLSTLSWGVRAQEKQEKQGTQGTQTSANPPDRVTDDYAFRLTLFVVEKIERSSNDRASDPLAQAANELFAADRQEQIRQSLEHKIGAPGNPQRAVKFNILLEKTDRKLSDKKLGEMRAELAKKGKADAVRRLCQIVGCK